ncbi:MAG: ABC transporter substrate-binding protein [Eubacteriaceae bacterium]|nr:ABC transporter substrate-binding protein [Eubacteriaceae bacterium]
MKGKKLLAVVLVLCLIVGTLAGCGKGSKDTFVVGYDHFSGKFSPFFATTAYDQDVQGMTQVSLLGYDREGAMVLNGIEGETRSYNGTDYLYTGIADCTITQNLDEAGNVTSVVYDLKMRDDIVFSDGTPATIDDAIFSLYVLCDPTYDGSSTFYALPIIGMEEYRSGMDSLYNMVLTAGPENTDFTYWTEEQQTEFWAEYKEAFVQGIVDYLVSKGYNAADDSIAVKMANWGFEVPEEATNTEVFDLMVEAYGGDVQKMIGTESSGMESMDEKWTVGIETGESAPNIAGVQKVNDYEMTITMSEFSAKAIYEMGIVVAPLHYYGSADLYDYDNNQFGFVKGDLSSVRAKTSAPMGAGPYKFVSYENGVVSFEANDKYWDGAPKTKYVKFQEITQNADKVSGIVSGALDISDPSSTPTIIEAIKEANKGELTGKVITYKAVDNNGYGYIGINSENVKVGSTIDSYESKCLRKALATLFAVYRNTVINSYYGERATVIQYPISNTSWAAPRPNDEGYKLAFSVDVDGNPIYTDDMNEEQKYEAALQAAIGFLKAAGYTWDDAEGKFTAAPEGARMVYEAIIPADGIGDHPAYGIFTNTKNALQSIGLDLDINDPADSNVLWDKLDANTQDIWAAAWGSALDPDMTQVYHSSNADGKGTTSNHYNIKDATLDQYMADALKSDNTAYRKSIYKECLEIIIDWAVEVPTYQRQNCFVFSTERLNIESLPQDMTPYWTWINGVDKIELK